MAYKHVAKNHTIEGRKQIALKANLKGYSAHPGIWANGNTVGDDWCCQHRRTHSSMTDAGERILQ